MIYSILKRLLPRPLRIFLRDLDTPYHELETKLEKSAQRILELEIELNRIDRDEPRKSPYLYKLIESEDFETLSRQGLFIVGNARSGTSILCDCFNFSEDIFLLGEANFHLNYKIDNFVDYFNSQHAGWGNSKGKGTFIPPSIFPETGCFSFLLRMAKNYRYVGEKIAFGPHGQPHGEEYDGLSFQEAFLNFHAKYFYHSTYFLILREPVEVLWSMQKMFPDRKIEELFSCWLKTVKVQIDVFQSFPRTYMILFEGLNSALFEQVNSILDVNIQIPSNLLKDEFKHSLLSGDGEIPDPLAKSKKLCARCHEIYSNIKEALCGETRPYNVGLHNASFGFSSGIHQQIDEIIKDIEKKG